MPTIINKHSETAGAVPAATVLTVGEIAVNTADKKWFTKTSSGDIVCLNYLTVLDGGEVQLFIAFTTPSGEIIVDSEGNEITFLFDGEPIEFF
jgi:hypothetical protein